MPLPAPRDFRGRSNTENSSLCTTGSSRVTGNISGEESQRMSNLMQEGSNREHSNSAEVDGLSESTPTQDDVDDLVQTESNGHSVADNIVKTTSDDHESINDTVQTEADDQVVVDDSMQSSVPSSAEFLSSPAPPTPAPWKSTRMLSTAHLHPGLCTFFRLVRVRVMRLQRRFAS